MEERMLVFIDESGDPGMKGKRGSSEFFVIAAVIFEDNEEAAACDLRVDRLREELGLHRRHEFHFNSCSARFREQFLRAVSPFNFFYHALVLNKAELWGQGFQNKESFYKYTTSLVFENAKPLLRRAKVIIDRCGDHEFRCQLARYLKRRVNAKEPGSLIRSVSMEASHTNNLLQLTDMVCGAVARSFKPDKRDQWAYRQLITHRELRVQVWPALRQ